MGDTHVQELIEQVEKTGLARLPNSDRIDLQQVEVSFRTVCSITSIPFEGLVTVALQPGMYLLEYESLERFIEDFREQELTHEEFCRAVYDAVEATLVPTQLVVVAEVSSPIHPKALAQIGKVDGYVYRGL